MEIAIYHENVAPLFEWVHRNAAIIYSVAETHRQRRVASNDIYSFSQSGFEEMPNCLSLGEILRECGKPQGFRWVRGFVSSYDTHRSEYHYVDHAWLEKENPDGTVAVLDLFSPQLIDPGYTGFAPHERTSQLRQRLIRATNEGIYFSEESVNGNLVTALYGEKNKLEAYMGLDYTTEVVIS